MIVLEDNEFRTIQKIIFDEVGIDLASSKKLLVQTRLLKRMLVYKFDSYLEYVRFVNINPKERIEMINLITTNETYFFREMDHFEFMKNKMIPEHPFKKELRVWSAAASVGAEAYSLAMLLNESLARYNWEVVGTDINTDVIKKARMGLYPEKWSDKIPLALKQKYCLKGKGRYEGQFLIERELTKRMHFKVGNLMEHNREVGLFDVIFLRNVLIYFDDTTKEKVVKNVLKNLHVGGYFIISQTENINMIECNSLKQVDSSIYMKIR